MGKFFVLLLCLIFLVGCAGVDPQQTNRLYKGGVAGGVIGGIAGALLGHSAESALWGMGLGALAGTAFTAIANDSARQTVVEGKASGGRYRTETGDMVEYYSEPKSRAVRRYDSRDGTYKKCRKVLEIVKKNGKIIEHSEKEICTSESYEKGAY